MHCPFCRHADSRVIDSRTAEDGSSIRRRRECPNCHRRFTTIETSSLSVVKRSGVIEPFSRAKVVAGVRKACQGRPVSDDDLAVLAQQVEEAVRASGAAQIDANDVGRAILGPLRELDEVAYLRFASVYSAFSSLEDFEGAIAALRHEAAYGPGSASSQQAADADESDPAVSDMGVSATGTGRADVTDSSVTGASKTAAADSGTGAGAPASA